MSRPVGAASAPEDRPAGIEPAGPRGQKGARTRRRIMDATAQLLRERAFGDIRITEIARVAEIAQPNFYTYFSSLEEVVLALTEDLSFEPLVSQLQPEWEGEAGLDLARRLVEVSIAFFREHSAMLAIVNMLADKRYGEFPSLRVRKMRELYKGFEAKVRLAQAQVRLSPAIQPRLAGYECVGMLAAAGSRYELFRASGFSHEQLIETTARVLHRLLGAA